MTRAVRLCGRLKDAGLGDAVRLELPPRASAREALEALRRALGPRAALLQGCALATAERVLGPAERVPARGELAALPPVCGG